jgi:ribosome-associated translation inhibitor RaiA
MIWHLKDSGVRRPKDLPDHIERRLRFALGRFSGRIGKVFVFLHDRNGPRGGVDKLCRILVKIRGCGVVVAAVADSDWVTAVDRATTRVGQTVARQVERIHDHHAARQQKASGMRLAFGGQE